MIDKEFEEELEKLAESGDIKKLKKLDKDTGTMVESDVTITKKGIREVKKQMKEDDDMALLYFSIFINRITDTKKPLERLVEGAMHMKKEFGVNIFRIIEKNQHKLKGLKIKKKLPEKLLKKFD